MLCNSEIWENFALDDLCWPQFWPHIKMTLVLSLELVKTYRVLFFRLSMRCLVFGLAGGGGGHICAPPRAVRRWLRPPAVRGLNFNLTIFVTATSTECSPLFWHSLSEMCESQNIWWRPYDGRLPLEQTMPSPLLISEYATASNTCNFHVNTCKWGQLKLPVFPKRLMKT